MSTHPDHPAPVPEPVSASGDAAVRCLPDGDGPPLRSKVAAALAALACAACCARRMRRERLRMLSTRTAASRVTRRRTGRCHAVYYRP